MTNNSDAPNGPRDEPDDKVIPEDAFISPDEPLVHDPFRDALIAPEEPLKPREEEGGVVVGMDGSTEHELATSGEVVLDTDQVAAVLEAVSTNLRAEGINGLRIEPGISPFEKNLRKYLAEYLSNLG